jgi:DNA polymerase elongation subunit (family B)
VCAARIFSGIPLHCCCCIGESDINTTRAIDKITTDSEEIHHEDLVISKLLRQDIEKYKSLFPHVCAAIQLLSNNGGGKHLTKGDIIQYIYTNSQHKNPLCRVVPLEILYKVGEKGKDDKENGKTLNYDKDKYKEMILDAAETVLGYFGFNRTVYGTRIIERKRNGMREQKISRQRYCNKVGHISMI